MKSVQRATVNALAVTALFVLGGCSGMSQRQENTAVGGLIGNQVGR